MSSLPVGAWLPILPMYELFLKDPGVLEEAQAVVKNGSKNGRSDAQRLLDATQGLALQYAVAAHLLMLGYTVSRAPNGVYHYDLVVNGVLVDIKGRFSGKYWQQTPWEKSEIEKTGDRVLYLCIDWFPEAPHRSNDQRFQHKGQCWSDNLEKGMYEPYVKDFAQVL